MLQEAPDDSVLKDLLVQAQTIAIVGVSDKPDRPSYGVAQWLINNSHLQVYLVNPLLTELFDRPVYPTLSEIPEHIDIVDVFRKIDDAPGVLDETIALNAGVFWLQLGLSSEEIAAKALNSNITPVMNRCTKIEYARLIK